MRARGLIALVSFIVFIPMIAYTVMQRGSQQGYALVSAVIFDTTAYPADGQVRIMTWRNDTGARLYIRKAYLWSGMYAGARADSDATVTRSSDGAIVAKLQWDHYAEPVAPVSQIINFEPGYMLLESDEVLTLTYYTTPIKDGDPFMAAAQFILWWSKD